MIKQKEITLLSITLIITKMLLVCPQGLAENSAQAAWIEAMYVSIAAALIVFFTNKIYPKKLDVIDLAQRAGGKGLKILAGIIVILILFVNLTGVMRIFPESVKIILLQDTNIEIISAAFALTAAAAAYLGINAVLRTNYYFIIICGFVFLLFLIFLSPHCNINNIVPILGNGAKSIFLYGFNSIYIFSDILIVNLMAPYFENADKMKKSMLQSTVISGIIVTVIMLVYCLSYEYPESSQFLLPVYQLSRLIHISGFFSRFEAFFQFVWSILVLIYASVYIYMLSSVVMKTFSLKFRKPLLPLAVILSLAAAFAADSVSEAVRLGKIFSNAEYPVVFLLPIVLSLMVLQRKKREFKERTEHNEGS